MRPTCIHPQCNKNCKINKKKIDGSITYRKKCSYHLKNKEIIIVVEKKKTKKYHKYKKLYCENIDGRLGFICDYKIQIFSQLELDHIDGNPYNNVDNHQTFCCNCHKFKTIRFGDHLSPGKKRKI